MFDRNDVYFYVPAAFIELVRILNAGLEQPTALQGPHDGLVHLMSGDKATGQGLREALDRQLVPHDEVWGYEGKIEGWRKVRNTRTDAGRLIIQVYEHDVEDEYLSVVDLNAARDQGGDALASLVERAAAKLSSPGELLECEYQPEHDEARAGLSRGFARRLMLEKQARDEEAVKASSDEAYVVRDRIVMDERVHQHEDLPTEDERPHRLTVRDGFGSITCILEDDAGHGLVSTLSVKNGFPTTSFVTREGGKELVQVSRRDRGLFVERYWDGELTDATEVHLVEHPTEPAR